MRKIIAGELVLALITGLIAAPNMAVQVRGAAVSDAAWEIMQETLKMEEEEDASGEEFVFITEGPAEEDTSWSKTENEPWEDDKQFFGGEEVSQEDIFQEEYASREEDFFSAGEFSDGDVKIIPQEIEAAFGASGEDTEAEEFEEEETEDSQKDLGLKFEEDENGSLWNKVIIGENDHELTLNVADGADITARLNTVLLLLKNKATDEAPYKVIIPPGKYELTGTICIYSNIHLYAVGAVIQKTSVNKHVLLRFGNIPESAPGYSGFRNITIEGGTWDLNYSCVENKEEYGGFVGFRMGHATNVVVKDAVFLNNLKSHFLELGGVKGAKITGCTFKGYWKPYEAAGQECIQLDVCKKRIFPEYLPFDGAVCEDILIDKNTFEDVVGGVGSHSMMFDRPYKNITITNNTFIDVKKRAVWCLNYMDSTVSGNVMKNVGGGVYVRSIYSKNTHLVEGVEASNSQNQQPENVVVTDNDITVAKASAINGGFWISFGIKILGENVAQNTQGVPTGKYILKGVTVKNNQISGPGHGICLGMADQCTVLNNKVNLQNPENFLNFGIYLGGSSQNTVAGNTIKNAGSHGIYVYNGFTSYKLYSNKNIIDKNEVSGCCGNGVHVEANSNKSTIQGNICLKNKGHGIALYNSSILSLDSNRTDSNSQYGIYAYECTIKDQSRNSMSKNAGTYMMCMKNCKGKAQSMKKFSMSRVDFISKKIGGTAPGAVEISVKLKKNNKRLAVAKVKSKWRYTLNIHPQKQGTALVVTAQDKYKNTCIRECTVKQAEETLFEVESGKEKK